MNYISLFFGMVFWAVDLGNLKNAERVEEARWKIKIIHSWNEDKAHSRRKRYR